MPYSDPAARLAYQLEYNRKQREKTALRKKPPIVVADTYGRWTVLHSEGLTRNETGQAMIFCRCECGTERWLRRYIVMHGETKSCGCLRREFHRARMLVHGQETNPLYHVWVSMKHRCESPRSSSYKYYGARGISVCERWRNSCIDFLADMGERPPGTSLDRIDNDGNYEPGNCKWSTASEQSRNRRRWRRKKAA